MRDVILQNTSSATDIQVTIGSTDADRIELPVDHQKNILSKNSTIRVSLNSKGGCGMLFLWNNRRCIWKGIIPLGNIEPLIVDPDTSTVTYGQIIIPEQSSTISREYFSATEVVGSKSNFMIFGCIVISIILLVFLVWLFMSTR